MDFTPDIAFAAAQIVAVLLVATMLDPWAKGKVAESGRGSPLIVKVGAFFMYVAKTFAVLVLLFDMQVVLFDNAWTGTLGYGLAVSNYVAITLCGFSIVLTVLGHIGALQAIHPRSDASAPAPQGAADRD